MDQKTSGVQGSKKEYNKVGGEKFIEKSECGRTVRVYWKKVWKLERFFTFLAGADADHFLDIADKDFAVTRFSGPGGIFDR